MGPHPPDRAPVAASLHDRSRKDCDLNMNTDPVTNSDPIPVNSSNPTRSNKKFILYGGILAAVVAAGVTALLLSGGSSSDEPITTEVARVQVAEVTMTGAGLPPMPTDAALPDPAVGLVAPVLSGTSPDASPFTIAVVPRRRLMVVAVAHWSPESQQELQRLTKWFESGAIPDDLDVRILSTSVKEAEDNYPPSAWFTRTNTPFLVLVDDKDSSGLKALGGLGLPNMHLIGSDGKVIARTSGEMEPAALEAFANTAAPVPAA
jgi:hypothetical protein